MDSTLSKTSMKDDQDFNIWFVKEIQKLSCLYNYADPNYSHRHKQDEAWQKIANTVNVGVTECKERWKNLRACFTRHLKHKFLEAKSGIRYKKPYYLAEHMGFILPFTKLRSQSQEDMKYYDEVVKQQQQQQQQQQRQQLHEQQKQQIDNDIIYVDTTENSNDDQHSPSYDFVAEADAETEMMYADNSIYGSNDDPLPQNEDGSPLNHDNCVYSEDMKSAVSIYKRKRPYNEDDDADLLFLKSLLPDIKSMNESQKRKFKIGVLKLSDDILTTV